MPRTTSIRLTLADVMVLILAIGLGLGGYILIDNGVHQGQRYMFGLLEPPPSGWTSSLAINRATGACSYLLVLFGGCTFAVPFLVARQPGPARRRLRRGPGFLASVAALFGMGFADAALLLSFGLRRAVDGSISLPPGFWQRGLLFDSMVIIAGASVAATWLGLLASGRWRSEPNAIDRLGRFVGLIWLGAGMVFATRQLLI